MISSAFDTRFGENHALIDCDSRCKLSSNLVLVSNFKRHEGLLLWKKYTLITRFNYAQSVIFKATLPNFVAISP